MKREIFQFKYEVENRQNALKIEVRSIQTNVLMWNVHYKSCISGGRFGCRHPFLQWSPPKKTTFWKILKLTDALTLFFLVLEAISKVNSKSFNPGNGIKNAWATTNVQCTLGTLQDGGWEKINNILVSYMLTRETTKEKITILVENRSVIWSEFWLVRFNMSIGNYILVPLFLEHDSNTVLETVVTVKS